MLLYLLVPFKAPNTAKMATAPEKDHHRRRRKRANVAAAFLEKKRRMTEIALWEEEAGREMAPCEEVGRALWGELSPRTALLEGVVLF